ncbi:hypothetical protein D3C78_1786950 [compost metagenome]
MANSIRAASVVVLPEPVWPVIRIKPWRSKTVFLSTGWMPSVSAGRIVSAMTRSTMPAAPWAW